VKTVIVVLRKVNPALLAWNFSVNPRKWANVSDGDEVILVSQYKVGIRVCWDSRYIQAVMPEVYQLHLNLRALLMFWVTEREGNESFRTWLGGFKPLPGVVYERMDFDVVFDNASYLLRNVETIELVSMTYILEKIKSGDPSYYPFNEDVQSKLRLKGLI